ncbi:MAG: helix-turn-helix transcriptional regulator [Spirochaetia bacterium]|nr:helix-turn-helix transcriptional regulator [Spirochaetia bacterium]
MALLNILNIAAAAFCFYLFVAVQRMKVRQREHRILSITAIALFQWTITAYFVYNSEQLEILRILLPISCIGMFFFFPLNFHFAYSLVYSRPMPKGLFFSLYTSAAALAVAQFFYPISMKIVQTAPGAGAVTQAVGTPVNLFWILYALSCWLLPTVFYIRYRRAAELNRQRRQADILIRMIVFTILIVMAEYYLPLLISWWNTPSRSPILFTPWVAAMVYAIWNYGFLRIAPGLLTGKILDSIEDIVILYSMDGKAVYRNRKALCLLGDGNCHRIGEVDILKKAVEPVVRRHESWTTDYPEKQLSMQVPQQAHGEHTELAASTESLTVKFRIKPVLDRFNDPLGVLVTGTPVPRYGDILQAYHLSRREAEVLEHLMAGWTIEKTARALFITERTVKAHISSIYEKTGATNRIELANLLAPTDRIM